jgi:hypothetical protein
MDPKNIFNPGKIITKKSTVIDNLENFWVKIILELIEFRI